MRTACHGPTLDERNEDHQELDKFLFYSLIFGIVFGFWLWFGALLLLKPLRVFVFLVVDHIERSNANCKR